MGQKPFIFYELAPSTTTPTTVRAQAEVFIHSFRDDCDLEKNEYIIESGEITGNAYSSVVLMLILNSVV